MASVCEVSWAQVLPLRQQVVNEEQKRARKASRAARRSVVWSAISNTHASVLLALDLDVLGGPLVDPPEDLLMPAHAVVRLQDPMVLLLAAKPPKISDDDLARGTASSQVDEARRDAQSLERVEHAQSLALHEAEVPATVCDREVSASGRKGRRRDKDGRMTS